MIEMKNISKKVGNKVILDDISLKIDEGSFVVFIGPSGCGKTTTLKLMNKLISPTSGEIYIDDKPISKEDPIKLRRNIGYVQCACRFKVSESRYIAQVLLPKYSFAKPI